MCVERHISISTLRLHLICIVNRLLPRLTVKFFVVVEINSWSLTFLVDACNVKSMKSGAVLLSASLCIFVC